MAQNAAFSASRDGDPNQEQKAIIRGWQSGDGEGPKSFSQTKSDDIPQTATQRVGVANGEIQLTLGPKHAVTKTVGGSIIEGRQNRQPQHPQQRPKPTQGTAEPSPGTEETAQKGGARRSPQIGKPPQGTKRPENAT